MANACCVYAIVGRDTPLPTTEGGGAGSALELVPWRELAAIVGPLSGERVPLTADAVLRHEAVVEEVRRHGPALPVRFGSVFRDASSVAAALAQRYEPLAADLDRLGEKVELSLTVLWAAAPSGEESAVNDRGAASEQSAGARYMRSRAAEVRREDRLKAMARETAAELDQVLGGLALERRLSLLPTRRVAVRASYLLEPAGVSAFREAIEAVRTARAELRLLLTGPWPPYSFVGQPAGDAGAHDRLGGVVQRLTDTMQGCRG